MEEWHGWAEGEYTPLQGGTDLFHLRSIPVSLHQASEVLVSFGMAHMGSAEVALPSVLAPVSGAKGQVLAEDSEANSGSYKDHS